VQFITKNVQYVTQSNCYAVQRHINEIMVWTCDNVHKQQ